MAGTKVSAVGHHDADSSVENDVGKSVGNEKEESELRLAQLQKQLPLNEPGALMHMEDACFEEEEDKDTRESKNLFKNIKFFLSPEVCQLMYFLNDFF